MPAAGTELQERFAVEYATNGGNATQAAISAGYSKKSASDLGRRTLALPHVQQRIQRELVNLRTRSGAVGLDAMVRIASDNTVPAAARVSAARALMEHAGLLGTAKDVNEVRDEAKRHEGRNVIDYSEVLQSFAKMPRARPGAPLGDTERTAEAEAC